MSAPWQALAAVSWAVVGPPLLIYAATRVRRGAVGRHQAIMLLAVGVELFVVTSFAFVPENPRRPALTALPLFKIHLAFAITALAGMGWQLLVRAVPPLRPLHRRTGPYVVFVWCCALLTGIYNFAFLYLFPAP